MTASSVPPPAGHHLAPRRGWPLVTVLILLVAVPLGCVVVANRFHVPPPVEPAPVQGAEREALPAAGDGEALRLVTWNLGYAGMGAEADFVADGGSQRRPASRALVQRNLGAIVDWVERSRPDVFFLQEVARPSWNTYRVDVLEALRDALPGYAWVYGADLKTRWVPPPLRVVVGNAVFSRLRVESAEWRGLPLEPEFYGGLFRKAYRMHVVRLAAADGTPGWVLVNVHLSAFDEGAVRRRQLRAVLDFAREEHVRGRRVVVGGDWNLRLADTAFPHHTADEHLFWIRDLPADAAPPGWTWAVDPTVPTVRTAHRPYVAGDNYVTIVDGFLVSPGVEVESVRTHDLGFAHSDHQPVEIRLRAAGSPQL